MVDPYADDAQVASAYRSHPSMTTLYHWFTRRWLGIGEARAPVEAVVLRLLGLAYLVAFIVDTFATGPAPGLHGRHAVVLAALVVFVFAAVAAQPQRTTLPPWRLAATLLVVAAASAVLAVVQPNGIWPAGPYFVGIMAALRLDRRTGAVTLALAVVVLIVVATVEGRASTAVSVLVGAVPWFLVMRLIRGIRDQRDELVASRAAEARAAAAAERGRVAREMHDVLAHSLSALALQLETTRLLARDRSVDGDVTRAIDQAHHLAASGLEEARRAIAAERGDELPGPERIGILAEAFGEQSGLPVELEVSGEPRELAPDARLAVYRTAQEALTNVRRHATPERVEVRLDYRSESTVLVVEDHAAPGVPAPVGLGGAAGGFGLTGMRERAELLGGELIAEPTAHGFRVELRLPA
jgi:signal transduction histidine kinase